MRARAGRHGASRSRGAIRLTARFVGFTLGAALAVAGVAQILVVAMRTTARTTPATGPPGVRPFEPTMVPIELGLATGPPRRAASFVNGVDWGWGSGSSAESIDPRTVFLTGDPSFVSGSLALARTLDADECGRPTEGVGGAIDPAGVGAQVHPTGISTWALVSALGGIGAFVAFPRDRRRRV